MKRRDTRLVAITIMLTVSLTACSNKINPLNDYNEALNNFLSAQSDFTAPIPESEFTTDTVKAVDSMNTNVTRMRETFDELRIQAQAVTFPANASTSLGPSQDAVSEYLDASEAYIRENEQIQQQANSCVTNGKNPYNCISQIARNGMSQTYSEVLKRVASAAKQLQQESTQD